MKEGPKLVSVLNVAAVLSAEAEMADREAECWNEPVGSKTGTGMMAQMRLRHRAEMYRMMAESVKARDLLLRRCEAEARTAALACGLPIISIEVLEDIRAALNPREGA